MQQPSSRIAGAVGGLMTNKYNKINGPGGFAEWPEAEGNEEMISRVKSTVL